MLIMLLITDIFTTGALIYSVIKSNVLVIENDPFVLNIALIFAIIDVSLWVITFLIIYEIKAYSNMHQRIVTLERILMEKGFNSHR